jgi:basic membrane lipoprotein Med (substrate-binding protein (PBP1-ABC) superfamily)
MKPSLPVRRRVLSGAGSVGLLAVAGIPGGVLAQTRPKVSAIYTVPVEQQWVSRIHKALSAAKAGGEIDYEFAESVTNADYERVMRQFAEKGSNMIVGESFAVEAAARKVARDYPKIAVLMG